MVPSSLPVVKPPRPPKIRNSRMSKWRAGVLVGIHVLIALHVAHYMWNGRTLSPVEPSESMYALELGEVNAGFVFLVAAMLVTLVFGRFFCGWACHLVAIQDLCGWVMKRLGVKPRPFRSRLLMWVPAAAAFYMFFWPALKRWGTALADRRGWLNWLAERDALDLMREIGLVAADASASFPGFTNHLATDSFWKTFPGPLWAVLTFVSCGIVAVYLLGSKGFCTYACPYGALFGAMDRLAPARIVVSDACEQCGHCTATCTSNVIVHEEVRRYGMVVDPGCMKCMDCVSVCPTGALSYGPARPSAFKRRPEDAKTVKRYNLGIGEELFVFLVFFLSTGALRGLYGRFPLLMSLGLGAITAFVALKLWQLVRRPTVRLENLKLKIAGKLATSGWVFGMLTVSWLAFVTDGAAAQWHGKWGLYHLNRTEAAKAEVLDGSFLEREFSERHHREAQKFFDHYKRADRAWRPPLVDVKLGLAWGYLLQDDREAAEREIRAAIDAAPDQSNLYDELIEFLASAGRFDEAIEVAQVKLETIDVAASERLQMVGLLMRAGRSEEARVELESSRRQAEAADDVPALLSLGRTYVVTGDVEMASALIERAIELDPESVEPRFQLAGILVRQGEYDLAIEQYRVCIELDPELPTVHYNLGALLRRLGLFDESIDRLERTLELAPRDLAAQIELGFSYAAAGRERAALEILRLVVEQHPDSPEAQFQLPMVISDLERRTRPASPPR